MPLFIADQTLSNLALDPHRIESLATQFEQLAQHMNQTANAEPAQPNFMHVHYVIRFDNKGFHVLSKDDVLSHYRNAHVVERLIITVENQISINSNKAHGTFVELRIDTNSQNDQRLAVGGDNQQWVTSTFALFKEAANGFRHKRGWVRSESVQLVAQLSAVILFFVISIWAAKKLAPQLNIESPFVFSFIFVFLILSNLWQFVFSRIVRLQNWFAPNAQFHRESATATHWLLQAVVGTAGLGLLIYLFSLGGSFFVEFVASLVNRAVN